MQMQMQMRVQVRVRRMLEKHAALEAAVAAAEGVG
eukprot:gene6754-9914_t